MHKQIISFGSMAVLGVSLAVAGCAPGSTGGPAKPVAGIDSGYAGDTRCPDGVGGKILAAGGSSPRPETEEARALLQAKHYEKAIESYLRAQKQYPNQASHYYQAAAAYAHLRRYREAIGQMTRALDIGVRHGNATYRREMTPHERRGDYYREIGSFPEALADFTTARCIGERLLRQAIRNKDKARIERGIVYVTHEMRRQIHVHELWGDYQRAHGTLEEIGVALRGLEQVKRDFGIPDSEKGASYRIAQTWQEIHRVLFLTLFADGRFAEAMENIRKMTDTPDKRTTLSTHRRLARRRLELGEITPQVTLRVAVLFFTSYDLPHEIAGKPVRIARKMEQGKIDGAMHRLEYMKRIYETISDGAISMTFDKLRFDARLTRWKGNVADVDTVAGVAEFKKNREKDYDVVVYVWDIPISSAHGGGRSIDIKALHTHGIFVHEMFHVVESLYGITPTHGYGVKERSGHPNWKGATLDQFDYYDWHFRTTVRPAGWDRFRGKP